MCYFMFILSQKNSPCIYRDYKIKVKREEEKRDLSQTLGMWVIYVLSYFMYDNICILTCVYFI